jgi:hypothetical protein
LQYMVFTSTCSGISLPIIYISYPGHNLHFRYLSLERIQAILWRLLKLLAFEVKLKAPKETYNLISKRARHVTMNLIIRKIEGSQLLSDYLSAEIALSFLASYAFSRSFIAMWSYLETLNFFSCSSGRSVAHRVCV